VTIECVTPDLNVGAHRQTSCANTDQICRLLTSGVSARHLAALTSLLTECEDVLAIRHYVVKGKFLYVLEFDARTTADEWPYNSQGKILICHRRTYDSPRPFGRDNVEESNPDCAVTLLTGIT
jgi:hypothetical protein